MNPTTCLDILEILYDDVICLEDDTLATKLARFRSEEVQWVLNMIKPRLEELRDSLELEEMNQLTFD